MDRIRAITWEAPEHHHIEKGTDWFWSLGILAVAAAAGAIMLGNTMFAIVIILGASTMMVFALREPQIIPYSVTVRGIRIGRDLYPYSTLQSFCIDEEHDRGPQLIIKSHQMFTPLLILPIPEEHIDDIESIIAVQLHDEHLEEPLSHKLLEFFGF